MIYLDNGATSFHKPPEVYKGMLRAMQRCANPGRGGYPAAMAAAEQVYACREAAGKLFNCQPEQVVITNNCTHGLNIAINTLVSAGDHVVVSGFEHNAVTRPMYALGAHVHVAGRRLFDQTDTLEAFENALRKRPKAAVFTHASNVFGYILPVEQMAKLCYQYQVPFVIDAAQSAGVLPVNFAELGADFIAMPGHKGLLGPQGTGLLLCNRLPEPLMHGGTGSASSEQSMPDFLPDRAEAGTLNVPGIGGLTAALGYLRRVGISNIARREREQTQRCAAGLKGLGFRTFTGKNQLGIVSFLPPMDCEEAAQRLAQRGLCVRAGLHCAPLAHESVGTLETGTVRVSFGHDATSAQTDRFLAAAAALK
ncbi:MAG: aminotransferase class V-fold PLP-dependent enzyme [Oscillospiraceae bacterium]|nr:aminotransferase class V-fold PLP-dependent enzyme [Oscillospiraceae bacterium]